MFYFFLSPEKSLLCVLCVSAVSDINNPSGQYLPALNAYILSQLNADFVSLSFDNKIIKNNSGYHNGGEKAGQYADG